MRLNLFQCLPVDLLCKVRFLFILSWRPNLRFSFWALTCSQRNDWDFRPSLLSILIKSVNDSVSLFLERDCSILFVKRLINEGPLSFRCGLIVDYFLLRRRWNDYLVIATDWPQRHLFIWSVEYWLRVKFVRSCCDLLCWQTLLFQV